MNQEIEAKFLNVDFAKLRVKLKGLGAECEQPMRLMKRAIIDYPELRLRENNSYIRVRDEGNRVTLTFKQFKSNNIGGAHEIEEVVESFEKTIALFEAVGMTVRSYQESKRETWKVDDVEVVLDEWPWLDPYIEIEADSEIKVKAAADLLGFDWNTAVFGDVMAAYDAQYPHRQKDKTITAVKEVKFGDPLPEIFKK